MEKVSIKTYAVKHKLSIFNVMKMVKSGKLKTVVEEENAKEITYILLDVNIEEEVKKGIIPMTNEKSVSLKDEIHRLTIEVKQLRKEVDSIKKSLL